MEYTRVALDRILHEGTDARRYVFTCRPDLTELASSIEREGILAAPVLQKDDGATFRVVCGWSRIQVLRQLGWKSVHAFVASADEMDDRECLARSILENRWHRGFNEVEKALLFTGLKDRFEHLLSGLAHALGKDLRVPREAKALEPYRFLLSLAPPILEGVARAEMSLAQALLLRGLPEGAHWGFYRIVTECRLTSQEARKAAEWIREAARREGRDEKEFIDQEGIRQILEEKADPRRKAQLFFSALKGRRYPLLESWNARFARARSPFNARQDEIQVSHDPTFETTQIRVRIRATSEAEFRQRIETLSEAIREGRIAELFQALHVNSEDPPKK
jgi:ParB-like chromosome segregation protein Spo0J